MAGALSSPRLQRLARRAPVEPSAEPEHCELCGAPIPGDHRHIADLSKRELLCACRACSLLFDRDAAGGGHFRLVPDRRLRLVDFELTDLNWERLRIPVDMAFFFIGSPDDRVMAFYPSPVGATESLLELDAWEELRAANPVLGEMQRDVEALLVNRARGARQHWVVPIDDCYSLVAVIRTRWKGLSGGQEVWQQLDRFFDELDRKAKPRRQGAAEREMRWRR
jgi:hypothetical protein